MEKKTRQVKLHSKYRCSRASGWQCDQMGKEVPWLNVSGVWLEQAGFKVGDVVEIKIEHNVLTIKNRAAHGNH